MGKPELDELLYICWVYTTIKSPSLRWKVYKYNQICGFLLLVLNI